MNRALPAVALLAGVARVVSGQGLTVVRAEFIADLMPTASAHASTVLEARDGLLAAWFGGTREGAPDVAIWLAREVRGRWTPPVRVATCASPDGTATPCWNPVLFREADGTIDLFYKAGPAPARWWGMRQRSHDDGRTWEPAEHLPINILGPIKNKPVRLWDGAILSGSSIESGDSIPKWTLHFERSSDGGRTWTYAVPEANGIQAIQPSILIYPGHRLQAIGRTRSGNLFETWSENAGRSWSPLALLPVPNPNAGIDAVTLHDGHQLLVYNNSTSARTPLSVALYIEGRGWVHDLDLETGPGEFSYPAVIQTSDGLIHITYTWKREKIRHVVLALRAR